ncbi:MAG: hypothetical protein NC453_26040 [Muribaculum sp.]|nr:hypothetical protein [Muribaculum sp.]
MTKRILNLVHELLSPQMPISNFGICGGYGGMALFYALYSKIFKSKDDLDHSIKILEEIKYVDSSSLGLKHGCLGLAFAIDSISYAWGNLLPLKFHELRNFSISKYLEAYQLTPIKYIYDDDMFSEGLYMLNAYRIGTGNELEYYYMLERMIGEVDSCETIMTFKDDDIYDSANISILNLCSIISYLAHVIDWKIYPYKSRILLKIALEKLKDINEKSYLDCILKHTFLSEPIPYTKHLDNDTLSNAGYYSLLFNNPMILNNILTNSSSVNLEKYSPMQLFGLGLGCEMIELNM